MCKVKTVTDSNFRGVGFLVREAVFKNLHKRQTLLKTLANRKAYGNLCCKALY
jgi:hypothetical protein